MADETTTLPCAGGAVTLRNRLDARTFHALPRAVFAELGALPFDEQAGPLTRLVTAWPFAGAPSDLAAWGELDVLTEMLPLWSVIRQHVNTLLAHQGERTKN